MKALPCKSVVSLESGLVEEHGTETLTTDFPLDGADDPTSACVDASEHLIYRSRTGQTHVCMAITRALGDRKLADIFLMVAHATVRDGERWSSLELSTLEPTP